MSSTTLARATAALLSVFSILAAAAPARGATRDDWWQAVERRIREAEYSVTWQDATPAARAGLQAPNRAQGLRTWFAPDGVRIVPRREQVPSWSLELELVSIGMGRDEEAPAPAEPIPNGNRVEYRRGDLVEWYRNDERGLEQGFTVACRPAGEGALRVALSISGTLAPALRPDGAGVDFLNTAGAPVLRYDHLLARDAARRALPARFRLEGMLLAIEVDVAAALFPVVIDPLAAAASWQAEGNQQGAQFGISVETAGDVNGDGFSDLVAGANLYDHGQADEGRAFLFLGSPSGLAAAPVWTAESDQANANFGISVRTAGDVNGDGFSDVIVGAMQYTAASDREGRAYVYHGSPAGLSGAAAWSADGEQAISFFGWSVGTAGDVNGDGFSDVIVGAPFLDDDQNSEGRVYVYHGSASGLSPAPTRTFSGDQNVALLGWSVGTAGDVNGDGFSDVILGAPMHLMPPPKKGFARVYHGSASGLPAIPAWVGFSPSPGTEFGLAVSGAGDVNGDGCSDVVVGAGLFASGQAEEGALYAYLGSASGLAQSAAWKVEGEQAGLKLGGAVSSAGDVNGDGCADVVAGAEGEARVYLGSIAGLALTPAWTADGGLAGGRFGGAVGLAGDVNGDGFSDVAVGAPQFDGGEADEGCACVFFGGASGVPGVAAWTCDGGQGGEALGAALADAGDVNGDGHADFLVGARGFDAGQADAGRVLLFHGSAGGPGAAADWVLDGVEEGAALGAALAGTGDVNGDGCSDVLLGAPLADAGKKAADAGAAYLHLGSTSGLASLPAWTIAGAKAGQTLGAALAAAGDVNGDGYADFLIGEPGFSGGEAGEGRASLFLGSKWGPGAAASWAAEGGQEGAGLGSSLAGAGDVDGDGFADVLAGAPGWDGAAAGEGQARLFLGSAFGLAANPAWSAAGGQAGARFGAALAAAGDVDLDGRGDALAGAPGLSAAWPGEGRAFLFRGTASGLEAAASWTADGGTPQAEFGAALASAGDVNGDGCADVLVGAPGFGAVLEGEGRAFLFEGAPGGLAAGASAEFAGGAPQARLGQAVAGAGDVNGDGYADLLLGAPGASGGNGRAALFLGSGGADHSWPRQRSGDDSHAIAPGGMTQTGDLRFDLLCRSVFGRARAMLEVELKPAGVPFDGSDLSGGVSFQDTGAAGVALFTLAEDLPAGLYHWRARPRFDLASCPLQPFGRWAKVPWRGREEPDFRVAEAGVSFVPGDQLIGFHEGAGDATQVCFDGLKGMGLALTFEKSAEARTLLLLLLDAGGAAEKWTTVKLGKKAVKKNLKLAQSGTHALLLIGLDGPPGPYSIATKSTLPKECKPFTKTLKAAAGTDSAVVEFETLPGALLSAKFSPKKTFTGPLGLTLLSPAGQAAPASALPMAGGGLEFVAVPLDALGSWRIEVTGFASPKEQVAAKITPLPPPPGQETVILP